MDSNTELVKALCANLAGGTDYTGEQLFEFWQTGENVIVIRQDPDQPLGTAYIEFVPYVEDTKGGQ